MHTVTLTASGVVLSHQEFDDLREAVDVVSKWVEDSPLAKRMGRSIWGWRTGKGTLTTMQLKRHKSNGWIQLNPEIVTRRV